jgi:small-conductance mechanosensitive channel
MAGTPDGSAFGFFGSSMPDLDDDSLADEEPEASQGSTEPEPEAERPEAQEPPPGEAAEAEVGEEEGEEQTEEDGEEEDSDLILGRFRNVDALVQAYREIQGAFTRVTQENAQIRELLPQYEAALRQLQQQMLSIQVQQDPELAERLQQLQELQPLLETQVAPLRQQLQQTQQQLEVQRRIAEAEAIVARFQARHPDVQPGSERDVQMAQLVRQLGLDFTNEEHLERVYEITQDPHLQRVVLAQPVWAQTEEGMDIARGFAREVARLSPAGQAEQGGKVVKRARAKAAQSHVETEGGLPVPSAPGSKDEFDEALSAYMGAKKSAFGI